MKVAYLDCFAGIAGDMMVGALLDAGLSIDLLQRELEKLNLPGWRIEAKKVKKHGIIGTKFSVYPEDKHYHDYHHPHRNLSDIEHIINQSELENCIKDTALKTFKQLAKAEAKVHGTSIEEIHFHEVGAVDAILDIVGAAIGFHLLGIEKVMSSSLTTGRGFINCAHGTIPIPAPATVELLKGVPYQHGEINQEMVTPTGAAVLTTICDQFGPMPEMTSETVGYGCGDRELPYPNMLRIHIGELKISLKDEIVLVIETNIDDMNPELYPAIINKLLVLGALDVTITQVLMKKGRPGCVLKALVSPALEQQLGQVILKETTALGYRVYPARRKVLERSFIQIETYFGSVSVKVAHQDNTILNIAPEYEDCLKLAKLNNVPVKDVYNIALIEAHSLFKEDFIRKHRRL